MKKSLGSILTRPFAAAVAFSLCLFGAVPAYAAGEVGSDQWKVEFNGQQMQSNYASADINDTIAGMQPGDDVKFMVALSNKDTDAVDFYMNNSVIKTLEDTQDVASGGAYTYKLTYTNPSGEDDVLYESENLGGEGVAEDIAGLRGATDQLSDYFFLDNIPSGQVSLVTLEVTLDGETQGNSYEDTFAQLEMNFAAEAAPEKTFTPGQTVVRQVNRYGQDTTQSTLAKTGDQLMKQSLIFMGIGAAGLVVLIIAIVKARSSRQGR